MDSTSSCSRVTSETSSNNSSNGDRKRVIDELTRGRLMTDELRRAIIHETKEGRHDASAGDLIQKIFNSFAQSISILTSSSPVVDSDDAEVSQIPPRKSDQPKDRRGCYKRRRTSETETRETPSPLEDGHAWRKYGQKVILNAKHPRNYFRCTHKYDQGCQATKQVQKIQDDLFRTTYHSHHTCKNLMEHDSTHQIIMEHDSSIIWSFQSHKQADTSPINNDAAADVVINPVPAAVKKEAVDKVLHYDCLTKLKPLSSSDHHDYNNFVGAHDQFLTYDNHESVPPSAFSSGSDHGDVYSCTASNHSMDMADLMAFDDLPEF